jgi:uncharacterized protein (DUF362 family)
MDLLPTSVYCARSPTAGYGELPRAQSEAAPELPKGLATTAAAVTLRKLLRSAGLDGGRFGSAEWNPLAELIPSGSHVVLKPNWVYHANRSGAGLDCLVTHNDVVEAVLTYVAKTQVASVLIGDAPVQGCDFAALDAVCGLSTMSSRWAQRLPNFALRDFRRTILTGRRIGDSKKSSFRGDDDFILFDLGESSSLEPVSTSAERFRITMYDPDALQRTHAQGKHQYLVAREVIDADVLINLPKLKTHRKAGVTGALKNVVGINGLKDYLPHHRKGALLDGGDCYERQSYWKRLAEDALDAANRANAGYRARIPARLARLATVVGRLCGHDANLEGSWHGNDTIWRTTLDLQRVLRYGRSDGRLASTPQRQIITITDAIIAGEGEGPLSPTPVPLGMMTLALNPAAADWVHAILMGFDPWRIPLVREAIRSDRLPFAEFHPQDINVDVDGVPIGLQELFTTHGRRFRPPAGWRRHCELSSGGDIVRCSA